MQTLDTWRQLPSPPTRDGHNFTETKICTWNSDAWLFFGLHYVLKFDMILKRWKYVETKLGSDEPWPYDTIIKGYCAEIFEGVLHIFGGIASFGSRGSNLHMALDLRRLLWTRLGGTNNSKVVTKGMPPSRHSAASWVAREERRMFVLYGSAGTPALPNSSSGPKYQHDDMWSYSFDERVWRRERLRGNFPSPRANMASVYDAKLQHVIIFGGINLRIPTVDARHSKFLHCQATLADTFVLDLRTRVWRHVITANFPHHRFDARAFVDESTGKIYLYGGECKFEFFCIL